MGFSSIRIAIILSLLPLTQTLALEREKSVANCAGEVVSVHGVVLVRQDAANGKKAETISIKPGNNVYPGDVINTASDGAVKILLKDKTIVDLGPSAMFKIAQFKPNDGANREAELDMMFGKMRVAVSKKISGKGDVKIKTRAATMGVRGTEFVVSTPLDESGAPKAKAAPPKTDITVLQGKVDVTTAGSSAAAPIHLTAGTQISTQAGVASAPPVKLNDVQLANVSSSSKVSDNTFMKAVTIEPTQESHSSSTSTASNSSSSSNRQPAESGSSGSSSSSTSAPATTTSASAAATAANIAASVPVVPVSFSNIGVPGAPSVTNVVNPVKQTTSSTYHVTVNIQ